jgi:phosphoglycolate phosphatase
LEQKAFDMSPALIFDLDGTLADTAPDLLEATNAVLIARGRRPIAPDTLHHMVGFGARSLIMQAMTATGAPPADEAEMDALAAIFLAHYREHIADRSALFPGVAETLSALKAKGARLGLLTNKPDDLTLKFLPLMKLDGYFDAVYGAGRMPYAKPDPRIFADVVRDVGGGPAVMIGDSVTDLRTGRAADAPVILVSYGYTPEPVDKLGADAVTGDFRAIPALAEQLLTGA